MHMRHNTNVKSMSKNRKLLLYCKKIAIFILIPKQYQLKLERKSLERKEKYIKCVAFQREK